MNNLHADLVENDIADTIAPEWTQERIWDELVEPDDIADWIEGGNRNKKATLANCMTVAEWMAEQDFINVPQALFRPFMAWFESTGRLDKRIADACDEDEFARATGRALGV